MRSVRAWTRRHELVAPFAAVGLFVGMVILMAWSR